MPKFTPETTIYLCQNTGIDDANKFYAENTAGIIALLMGKVKASFSNYSYQRADEREYCTINYDYYQALDCDVIMWRNSGHSQKWIVANVTELEWVNPNTTRVYFKVDAWTTFCGEVKLQPCFVEREHVENDWNGGIPNWNAIGAAEAFSAIPERITGEIPVLYTPDKYVVVAPFTKTVFDALKFEDNTQYGIATGLNDLEFNTPHEAKVFLNTVADTPNSPIEKVQGVYSVPSEMLSGTERNINGPNPPWNTLTKYHNAKTFSSQYCCCKIDTIAGQGVTYKPELMPTSSQSFRSKGYFMNGNGGIVLTLKDYAGTMDTWSMGATIDQVPAGMFIGDQTAQLLTANSISTAIGGLTALLSFGATVGATAMLGPAGAGVMSGAGVAAIRTGAGLGLAQQAARGTGNFINGVSQAYQAGPLIGGQNQVTANRAVAMGCYGFFIRWYVPRESIMDAVDSFFDRFGYQVDQIKVPSVSRPIWNFVKTKDAHVEGAIPASYRQEIESMLNSGVTFWVMGQDIGDFSNPEANKG